jgi:hypothetical protein
LLKARVEGFPVDLTSMFSRKFMRQVYLCLFL